MKYKDLTDTQQKAFSEAFYMLVDFDDTDSPMPWGCPWLWRADQEVLSDDMQRAANFLYEQVKKNLEEIFEEEKKYKDEG